MNDFTPCEYPDCAERAIIMIALPGVIDDDGREKWLAMCETHYNELQETE